MKLFLLCVLLGAACAVQFELEDEWQQWKVKYGKSYEDEAEESVRKLVWKSNWEYVQQHTAEKHTYTVHTNHLADMTNEEYQKFYLSQYNMLHDKTDGEDYVVSNEPMDATVDWRTKGVVTGIKNQGQCGSCWSFSATGSLEGQHALKTGKLVSLSEQNLMDCSTSYGDHSCKGGLMDNAFRYIKANGGVDTETCYPYMAHDETCRFKTSCVGATLTSYVDVTRDSETALQDAVQTVGPISVAIDASHKSFQLYHYGVYNEPECSSTKLDHGVLAVGYGEETSAYWLVKNSWGMVWGSEGYIMMSRNLNNQCGIASAASYPVV